jgi:uncharacterized membrane protein
MSDLERKMEESDVPVQIIVAAFPDEGKADAALKQLQELKKEHMIGILDAAVVRKGQDGKLHVKETEDMGGGRGSVIGGGLGAMLGLLGGPAGLLLTTAGGALIGGLVAKSHDANLPNERLQQLGEALTPGSSAVVAIIEHRWVEDARQALAKEGADIVAEDINADVHRQLAAGGTVAYTAVSGEGGMAAERVATTGEQIEAQAVVVTPEGVAAGEMKGELSPNGEGAAGKETPAATGAAASQPQAAQPQTGASAPAAGTAQSPATSGSTGTSA